jgi:hypothetical protein
MTDLALSNSLTDLAARIKAERQAAESCMWESVQHAINLGNLLIEAKAQLPHGQWLPWLRDHVELSTRSAQLYMQLAKAPELDGPNAQRVAHLPLRDVAVLVAQPIIMQLIHMRVVERRAALAAIETPRALLPLPQGRRRIRVARNPKKRQWLLTIGPNISHAELKEKQKAARETSIEVQELQRERDEATARIAALEAEIKALREAVKDIDEHIHCEIREWVGPADPFTRTFDFECDERSDRELAALNLEQRIDRLLAARNGTDADVVVVNRGYWGDATLTSIWPLFQEAIRLK